MLFVPAATTTGVRPAGVAEAVAQVEDRTLAHLGVLLNLVAGRLRLGQHLEHPGARGAGRIERAALDQRLDRLLVDAAAVDALAEIPDRGDRSIRVARLDDRLDRGVADVLDGVEAEADVALNDEEVVPGLVDIRRQNLDAHFLAA